MSSADQGGIGSGTLRTIGLVPMLAIFTAGPRRGRVWTALCTLDLLGFAAKQADLPLASVGRLR